jgi:acetyl-CoA carboxylase carboxyltransferase component
MARRFLAFFPSNNVSGPPLRQTADSSERRAQSPDRIVPDEPTRAYGTKAVICAIVDDGDHIELQLGWARPS